MNSGFDVVNDALSISRSTRQVTTSSQSNQGKNKLKDIYDSSLDDFKLRGEEIIRATDSKYTFDFRKFPVAFSSIFEAVD